MATSEERGVVDLGNTYNDLTTDLEDAAQSFLVDLTGLKPQNVRPARQILTAIAPEDDFILYEFGAPTFTGTVSYEQTDEEQASTRTGSIDLRLYIYGQKAQELRGYISDAMEVNQHGYEFHRLGLGYVSSTEGGVLYEPVADKNLLRADLTISFNYTRTRVWAIKALTSANVIKEI